MEPIEFKDLVLICNEQFCNVDDLKRDIDKLLLDNPDYILTPEFINDILFESWETLTPSTQIVFEVFAFGRKTSINLQELGKYIVDENVDEILEAFPELKNGRIHSGQIIGIPIEVPENLQELFERVALALQI